MTDVPIARELDEGHPRRWLILAAVSLGMFMALLDVTIVNIAIPALMTDLHTSVTHVSWVLNAYSLVLAAFFLSMGRVSDRFGQKRVFVFGLAAFTLFSLLCGLAPTIGWLIAFRAAQGVGGAALSTVSLAIVLGAFPKPRQGMAVGLWGALGTAAAAIGPTLGGLLVTYGSWHWIFFVNVPIGIGAIVFALAVIPEHRAGAAEGGIDIVGITISTMGLFLLTLALIQGNSWGWTSGRIIALFVAALASFPLFVWWEVHTGHPMFDFKLLRIRSFTAANTAMTFVGMAMGGTFLMVVIFLVSVLGYSELRAALALTVMPLTALVVAPNSGRLADRIGPRLPAALGASLFTVGLVLLAQLGGETRLVDVLWRVVFIGGGMGLAMPVLSAASMSSLPPEVRGVGSGALNTMRQVGFTLGVAVLVSIFSHTVVTNAQQATHRAIVYVNKQPEIPAAAKAQIAADLVANVKRAGSGGGTVTFKNPLAGAPTYPSGSPQAALQQHLSATIGHIYREKIADSFTWPFYAAALAALFAVFPALLTGARLGEHEGDELLSRKDRRARQSEERR